MKKILIILSVVLLCGAGYFIYDRWIKNDNVTSWSFVPSDAALVFEADLMKDFDTLRNYRVWKNLEGVKGFDLLGEHLQFLDSINGEGEFSSLFKKVPALVSIHKVSSSKMDFLFILDVQDFSQNTFISTAIGQLKEAGYRFRTRNYDGFSINEIRKNEKTLTYIFHKNFFLASFTPYLVEDAIRTLNNEELSSFDVSFPLAFQENTIKSTSKGAVYVNFRQAENLISAFSKGKPLFPASSGAYDLQIDSGFVSFTGLSFAKDDWLSIHSEAPAGFEMAEVIPSNAAILYHFTSTNFEGWKERQATYLEANDPFAKRLRDSLKTTFDFNTEQAFGLLDDEMGFVQLESGRPDDNRKLFILKVKDMGESLSFFRQVAERIAYSRGDSVYTESYSENEIRFFPVQNFPVALLGKMADGFDRCFYMSFRNYLIFSNNLQELKNLIISIEEEDTWGKSIHVNQFLEQTNDSNISLFVNLPRAWPLIFPELKTEWQTHFGTHEQAYKKMEFAAFQFSYLEEGHFTNFTFSQPEKSRPVVTKTNADNGMTFASPVISKPYLVRTHAHNHFDILVQDSSHTLYFIDRSLSSLWSEKIGSPIVSEVIAIDYYRNRKLQYAFATDSQVHIIDRTGTYIPGYPKSLPGAPTINHFSVIDYDKSRNYRLSVTDENGRVYLTDKDLNLLEGWGPLAFNRAAIQPLRHARLGRKDIMMTIQENGVIEVMNRRGIKQPGFPFDLQAPVDGYYFLSPSNSLAASSLTLISKAGELVEVNLEGGMVNRDQLLKSSPDAVFRLIPDRGERSFILVRKEGSAYEVLDATGNLLFAKDYLSQNDIIIQYYQFGAGKDLVIFTDTANESLYIYDLSGNLITGTPLRSSHEVSLLYSSSRKELQVYATSGSNLEFYKLDF